ncbi:MAG TPA: sucrase ferredoxin, partial [Rubrobacter sp.]|nr:sucrase ferredoxin [Rubrobacter sp.]
ADGRLGAFSVVLPDRDYSRNGHTRVLFLRRSEGPFSAYEKVDLLVPDGELVAAVGALLEGSGLGRFGRYRQETDHVRDLLVCTHGSRDVCCGKFGYPVYDLLRRRHASPGKLRVWRTSHTGGHRFAPTMIDYPEGRLWGHLEPWAVERLAARRGPVSDLGAFYRGWAGLRSPAEQAAEREVFAREGWAWTGYLKEGSVLNSGGGRTEVRIAYRGADGAVSGAYEATVEVADTVMTMESSGDPELVEVDQYRVVRLEKA